MVNKEKTHLTSVHEGVAYLGFIIHKKYVSIHPKKIEKFKDKIRKLTPRNHGMSQKEMIKRLNPVLKGWANYFRIANCKMLFAQLLDRLNMEMINRARTSLGKARVL